MGSDMDCPFRLCSAWVKIVIEQARPDDDETTLNRVPMHDLEGRPGVSSRSCPASLLEVPLSPKAEEVLEEQATSIERIAAEERSARPITSAADKQQGGHSRHSRTARTGESLQWFRARTGDNPDKEFTEGHSSLRPVLVPPQGGGSSTVQGSHAESGNALLAAAREKLEWGQGRVSGLSDELDGISGHLSVLMESGRETLGLIITAAEGSQTHSQAIQEVLATVAYATGDEASSVMAEVASVKASLQDLSGRLGAAREQIERIIF